MTRRRLWRIVMWLAPVAGLIVVVSVLRGAGVPLTLPGVLITLVVLFLARLIIGRARRARRRTDRR